MSETMSLTTIEVGSATDEKDSIRIRTQLPAYSHWMFYIMGKFNKTGTRFMKAPPPVPAPWNAFTVLGA